MQIYQIDKIIDILCLDGWEVCEQSNLDKIIEIFASHDFIKKRYKLPVYYRHSASLIKSV